MAAKTPDSSPAIAGQRKDISVMRLCLVLAMLSFAVYANTLKNGFALDDAAMITDNTIVARGFSGIPELLRTTRMVGVGHSYNDNYRPLSLVMFAIERQLFGESPMPGHFFNILFFAGCVVLLFLFIDRLFGGAKRAVALIAALLFMLHPIHTEVVANIKSRDEIMCFFFAFFSLNLLLSYMEKGRWQHLALAGVSLFLSFLAKETVITFLAIIPFVFFFIYRVNNSRAVFITVCTVIVASVFLVIRARVLNAPGLGLGHTLFMDNALVNADTPTRIATAVLILGKYLLLLFVPYPLSCDYCYNSIPFVGFGDYRVLVSLALYISLVVVSARLLIKDRKSPWAFGIIFFLITLSVFSNIPFLIGAAMGERFLFFPSVGFCIAAALAIEKWLFVTGTGMAPAFNSKKVWAVVLPLLLVYTGLTIMRNNDWTDNYTLFKADVEKLPGNAKLNYFIGNELVENMIPASTDKGEQRQMLTDALSYLGQALNIYPGYADAHTEAGNAYMVIGAADSSVAHFSMALRLDSLQSTAANNLAVVYLRQRKFADAVTAYKKAVALLPSNAQAYFDLGGCYIELKQYDDAIAALQKALALDAGIAGANMQLGFAYFQTKKYDEAEKYIKKELDAHPNDIGGLGNLGTMYLRSGQQAKALEVFKKVRDLAPNSAGAYSNLGHCYFSMKQYNEAIEMLGKAISMHSKNEKDIPRMALSYSALGKRDLALQFEALAKKSNPGFSLKGASEEY